MKYIVKHPYHDIFYVTRYYTKCIEKKTILLIHPKLALKKKRKLEGTWVNSFNLLQIVETLFGEKNMHIILSHSHPLKSSLFCSTPYSHWGEDASAITKQGFLTWLCIATPCIFWQEVIAFFFPLLVSSYQQEMF